MRRKKQWCGLVNKENDRECGPMFEDTGIPMTLFPAWMSMLQESIVHTYHTGIYNSP